MAHVKAGGVTRGNRDSVSKRLGVKIFGSQRAQTGAIIIRQRGTKWYAGEGAAMGRDFTIYATVAGVVSFHRKRGKQYVSVLPV